MLYLDEDKNLLKIRVGNSDTEVGVYYRMPTVEELRAYKKAMVTITANKVKYKIDDVEEKIKHALPIFLGIREGDFGVKGAPISSDPSSPHYRDDWQALIAKKHPAIVVTIAAAAFEGTRLADGEHSLFGFETPADDKAPAEVEEEKLPLPKSSGA